MAPKTHYFDILFLLPVPAGGSNPIDTPEHLLTEPNHFFQLKMGGCKNCKVKRNNSNRSAQSHSCSVNTAVTNLSISKGNVHLFVYLLIYLCSIDTTVINLSISKGNVCLSIYEYIYINLSICLSLYLPIYKYNSPTAVVSIRR